MSARAIFFALFLFAACAPLSQTEIEQVFAWTVENTKYERCADAPSVLFLNQHDLEDRYVDTVVSIPKSEARKRVEGDLTGFFDPKAILIFIGTHIPAWEVRAVVVHEMVHYLQHMCDGILERDAYGAEERWVFREIEAYQKQDLFLEMHK